MPIISCERTAQQQTQAQNGETSRLTETWLIRTDTAMTSEAVRSSTFLGKPRSRTRHPTATRYVCARVGVECVAPNTWRLTAEYTSRHDEVQVWSRLQRRGGTRDVRLWKAPGTLPTDGIAPWPPTTEATGTSVDIMGAPGTRRVWKHDLTVELTIDVTWAASQLSGPDHWQKIWTSAQDTRNDTAFLGYSKGTVVFKSWSEQMVEDPWLLCQLHFEADEYFHLEQEVLPSPSDGHVLLTLNSTWASQVVLHAGKCYWHQPYHLHGFSEFSELWDFSELYSPSPA